MSIQPATEEDMEIEYISSDYNSIYFIRGHIDKDIAMRLLKKETDDFYLHENPKHTYFRARPDHTGEFKFMYHEYEKAGYGAFAVTMMNRDW